MSNATANRPVAAIGMDLGDKYSQIAVLGGNDEFVMEERIRTTRTVVERFFRKFDTPTRVILEASTHSSWISALLKEIGHEPVVANPQRAGMIMASNGRKNDQLDARTLAEFGARMVSLLRPIEHRSQDAQQDLAVLRARAAVIRTRTLLINAARSLTKVMGYRLPSVGADAFARKVAEDVPPGLERAFVPLLDAIAALTLEIKEYNKQLDALCAAYPETKILRQINGVGRVTALTFILTLEDPKRFAKSRKVGAFVGLVPKQHESGDSAPQLRITKAGDSYLRQCLVTAAHYILGPFGDDCNLRRYGERLSARGGKRAKKQAVVAVARKLAVLMHRLWSREETYDPLYRAHNTSRRSPDPTAVPAQN